MTAQNAKRQPMRRCEYCRRAVGRTDPATGAVTYPIHSPPGGGYCPNETRR